MRGVLPLLTLASAAQALHFFIDLSSPKCFYEDLPKDTLVVGHYAAEEWDDKNNAWQQHAGINIYISVDVRRPPSLLQAIPLQELGRIAGSEGPHPPLAADRRVG